MIRMHLGKKDMFYILNLDGILTGITHGVLRQIKYIFGGIRLVKDDQGDLGVLKLEEDS